MGVVAPRAVGLSLPSVKREQSCVSLRGHGVRGHLRLTGRDWLRSVSFGPGQIFLGSRTKQDDGRAWEPPSKLARHPGPSPTCPAVVFCVATAMWSVSSTVPTWCLLVDEQNHPLQRLDLRITHLLRGQRHRWGPGNRPSFLGFTQAASLCEGSSSTETLECKECGGGSRPRTLGLGHGGWLRHLPSDTG